MKKKYTCTQCSKKFERYENLKRPAKSITCSKDCRNKLYSYINTGNNNPNYKSGKHCTDAYCRCGKKKDYRSTSCSSCSGRSHSINREHEDTTKEIYKAVTNSKSILEASKKLKQSRKSLKEYVDYNNIDVSHFSPSIGRKLKKEDLLTLGPKSRNGTVKKFILENKLFTEKCSTCGLGPVWNNQPLTLQLDHINGNPKDNKLENLRLLCPNCHAQTSTFCGKNARKNKQ